MRKYKIFLVWLACPFSSLPWHHQQCLSHPAPLLLASVGQQTAQSSPAQNLFPEPSNTTYMFCSLISPSPLCPCWQPLQLPGQPSDSGHAGTHGPCAAVASSCLTANMSHITSLHGTGNTYGTIHVTCVTKCLHVIKTHSQTTYWWKPCLLLWLGNDSFLVRILPHIVPEHIPIFSGPVLQNNQHYIY